MPTNHTENYQLSQWEKTDKVQMEDFNADNLKIDGALKANADALAALAAAKGNCTIEAFTYVGDASTPTRITFSRPPLFFVVFGENSIGTGSKLCNGVTVTAADNVFLDKGSWKGNTISFANTRPEWQFNIKDKPYFVFAFYASNE